MEIFLKNRAKTYFYIDHNKRKIKLTNADPLGVSLEVLLRVFVLKCPQNTGHGRGLHSVQEAHLWVLQVVVSRVGPPPQSFGSRTAVSFSRLHCLCLVLLPPPQDAEHSVQGLLIQPKTKNRHHRT